MSSLRPCGREKDWGLREDRVRNRHGKILGPDMCKHIFTYSYMYVSGIANAVTLRNRIEARTCAGMCRDRGRENKTRKHEVEWNLLYTASRADILLLRIAVYRTSHTITHACLYTGEQ